jgi:hypothetical protein
MSQHTYSQTESNPPLARIGTNTTPIRIPHEQIARRAFQKFQARGSVHGHDLQDWLAASQELRAER